MKDLRVRAGAQTNRNVVMEIAGMAEEIDVLPPDEDTQLLGAFTEQLTAEQLAALPDDPDELAQVLQQLVGEDADIRVNGFAGGRLPPGTQIQEVRVRYDAASGSGNGGPRIEVRTRPGSGRWRNSFNMNMRDDSMNARNAFSGERPSGQTRQYAWNVDGPLVRNRTGISLSIDRAETQEQQAIRAARPDGIFSSLISQPSTRTGVSAEIEHALTNTQELRADINFRRSNSLNQGVSEFDLPERAFSRTQSDGEIRLGHRTTIRRQYVNNLRLQYQWSDSEAESASDAMTIRVLDAFTIGGAQISGGRRSRDFQLENELEFTVKKTHQMAFGATISGSSYSVDEVRNTNGTFTFASLEMYQAGMPTTYTQRTINPNGGYSLHQFGWYLQDSYRVNRSVMISGALRHDMQTRLSDWTNFSPRASISWTLPGRKTTLRSSIGVWPQFFEGGLYEQTLWANGQQQRDIVISNPGYPDPFLGGIPLAGQPPSIVRAHPGIVMPYTRRASVGVDRTLTSWARLRANYSHQIGRHLFRSRDLNAPIDGVRPDPTLRNITQLESTARSQNKSLEVNVMLNHRPRRFSANVGYTLGRGAERNGRRAVAAAEQLRSVAGVGAVAAGCAAPAVRVDEHRREGGLPGEHERARAVGGALQHHDRARRESRRPDQRAAGRRGAQQRPRRADRECRHGARVGALGRAAHGAERAARRRWRRRRRNDGGGNAGAEGIFRFEIFARASNVLNLVNAQNFSGVLTSPFFGRATSAAAPRRLVLGMRAFF